MIVIQSVTILGLLCLLYPVFTLGKRYAQRQLPKSRSDLRVVVEADTKAFEKQIEKLGDRARSTMEGIRDDVDVVVARMEIAERTFDRIKDKRP